MKMVLPSVYLFNVFCAMIPCSVPQPPPQAYINDNYEASTSPSTLKLFQTNIIEPEPSFGYRIGSDDSQANQISKTKVQQSSHSRSRSLTQFQRKSRMIISSSGGSQNQNPIESVVSNILSAVPAISVLRNNFNTYIKTISLNERNGGAGGTIKRSYPPPQVLSRNGMIEGYFMGTMKGRRFSAFEGIPYAEPPTGQNRFKPPIPKRPWKGVLKAKKAGSNCLQAHPLEVFKVTGSESCLFLSVYTPQISFNPESLRKYPVIFLIHGGSFQYGSSSEYGPSYLLDKAVILVIANYRLGPLGFLSTGDLHSPGNYGLKDQAAALKWVFENIGAFGGDNSKITVLGQSAGGVSAHLHLVSNQTSHYVNNGVSLSGTGFGFWPILEKSWALHLTRRLASAMNCPQSSSRAIVDCLRSSNANLLIYSQLQLYDWIPLHPLVLFGPVIEDEGSPDAFLTKSPEDAYRDGEVTGKPWIFGQTSQEGHFDIYFMKLLMQAQPIAFNGRKYLPMILDYGRTTEEPTTSAVTDAILNYYGGSLGERGIDINKISDMYTDRYYTATIRKAMTAHSTIAPTSTYAYVFDYKGKYNLGSLFGSQESDWGVAHTEDMFFYFNSSVYHHGLQRNDKEYGLSQIMTEILENFADKSDPNGANPRFWDPVSIYGDWDDPQYLGIRRKISMIKDPFMERVRFWNSLGIEV